MSNVTRDLNSIPQTACSVPFPPNEGSAIFQSATRWSGRTALTAIIACLLWFAFVPVVTAQDDRPALASEPGTRTEKFIPSDQLETVFDRDRRGVMMNRNEFKALLEKARANSAAEDVPVSIITEHATLKVAPRDQLATVQMELKVRQYAEGWQVLRIRAENLLVEKIEIDGQPALIGRDPADPAVLVLAHNMPGQFSVVATMSTQLATSGSDLTAAFQLPVVPAVSLTVECAAGRHLLVNDLKLERPAAIDAAANYVVPVGNATDVRLRWVVEQKEAEAQTLVFVRTDGQLQVQKESLRWESDSRISVFGGSINRVVARVPARLEITSVESAGLEAWNLDDDPDNPGQTRVTLTYRQPFTNDRLIRLKAVASAGEGGLQKIPTLQFSEVTAHTGRLIVNHEDGLRLASEAGAGVRPMSAAELGISTDASVFDFWLQQYELQVAAMARDRELFAESSASLAIDDTTLTFAASLTIETLNAPLFEIPLTLPADWQLTSVTADGQPVPWNAGSTETQILVRPIKSVAPGQMLSLVLQLTRTIADPDVEQKLTLPVVTAAETTIVGGTYKIQFSDDLTVSPLALTGLTPIAGSGTEQIFQNPGTTVSGELSIVRRPARLAVRSVLRTWADSRQQSLDAEIVTDVLTGTIRTLTIRLSESLGPDVRFDVRNVSPVPGMAQTRAIRPVSIVEQSAGTPADGLRPFVLKLDHRFAGSLSLHAFVQQPRTDAAPLAAPVIQVQEAVRQHGVLVFEAAPEQQLSVGPEVRLIPGLFVADAGLVDPPDPAAGRRIALTWRFVQPGYSFAVQETRFVTSAVPSAVCEQVNYVCTLNDSGTVQGLCSARIRASGVQTLRFTLPDAERSFLWSTMLSDEPVEVRRDGQDYLVAVPLNSESQVHVLTVLFESEPRRAGILGKTDQGPVQFFIDAGDQATVPLDVLQQQWRVHYPQSSLLVDTDGQFHPTSGVDQPGWLASLFHISLPNASELPGLLIPLTVFLLLLFVVTVMVSRRRWKTLAAVCCVGLVLGFFLMLSTAKRLPLHATLSKVTSESAIAPQRMPHGFSANEVPSDDLAAFDSPPNSLEDRGEPFGRSLASGGGMGGLGGGAPRGDMSPNVGVPQSVDGVMVQSEAAADPFGDLPPPAPAQLPAPAQPPAPESAVPQSPASEPVMLGVNIPLPARKMKKGNARLSVNVALDVPSDYQSREFISVADAVHQPSVLSFVILKRGQISAIRMLAAMVVILLTWRMRNAAILWKLTFIVALLLIALGLLPLLSNAWQSVLDGVAIGALISLGFVVVMSCFRCCTCPLTWWKTRRAAMAL